MAKLMLLHFAKVNLLLKQGRKLMGGSGKSSNKINKMSPMAVAIKVKCENE